MPPESRIDRRARAAALLTFWSLTAWSWTTTKWCQRRVDRTRHWWGF